jgi:di/tricarboxylate transporter
MTQDIALTLAVIVLTLIAFIKEWAAADVIALSVLCLVVALGLVSTDQMLNVFKNEAPVTIAALFVIGGALEKSGAVDHIGEALKNRLSGNIRTAILAFSLLTAFFSAWMNNTAIVAILLPVTLGFARSKNIAASKLLMPLSYSSILGGCCTLIGTSTNIVVNGALKDAKMTPMSMFELAPVGVPLAIAGVLYLVVFGPKIIPDRSSISGSLDIEQRSTPLYHILIGKDSPMIGKPLPETPLFDREGGVHLLEIRRNGHRIMAPMNEVRVEPFDRFLVAVHGRKKNTVKPEELFETISAQVLSTVPGIVTELVVRDESSLIGRTLARSDFRQNYNAVVLAVHRDGVNITKQLATVPLEVGDTLLVVTALNNLDDIEDTRDFILTDKPEEEIKNTAPKHHMWLSWSVLIGVVAVACITDLLHGPFPKVPVIPIHYCSLVGALVLLWGKVVTPRDAYSSIDWQVLLMLYGLLGLGMAMSNTGTASYLAVSLVKACEGLITPALLPLVILWLVYLLSLMLTEVLSNNATALMMVPIVTKLATELHVDPRGYIIAVTVAASAAFSMPMGYQTHLMVYGPGGYRFSDFLRVGLPLNIICWVIACLIIPLVWPLHH